MNASLPGLAPAPVVAVPELASLIEALRTLRADMLALESEGLARCRNLHPVYLSSARNLLHYLALRRRDLRGLQDRLAQLGLSSLGRCEPAVLATVDAVLCALHGLAGSACVLPPSPVPALGLKEGHALLDRHAETLLGPPHEGRRVRILVTLPSEAADDPQVVLRLLAGGMDCARINCAHDDAPAWGRMIAHLRQAEARLGRRCRVLMDLAGPKLRTGPVETAPAVVKLKPERDAYGRVLAPVTVTLLPIDDTPPGGSLPGGTLAVTPQLLVGARVGDALHLLDARGARRRLRVIEVGVQEGGPAGAGGAGGVGGVRALLEQTTYVAPGAPLSLHRAGRLLAVGTVASFAGGPGRIRVKLGELLEVTRSLEPGRSAQRDANGYVTALARIGCTLPEVFADVRVGEPIWFDDGRIGGTIREVDADHLRVEVTRAAPKGESLAADKGINLPESELHLAALTAKDLEDLAFVVAHADAVALSFVSRPADVDLLEEHLRRLGRPDLGIVLKIETRSAFERLPELLLASMQSPCDGVMIARGDLAVECGWQRLAEVQEEILWLCEAAHIPVIWATQVLEGLAKDGRATRAEITDAAMGERAECVMLNKGPHLDLAVHTLDDILRRMQEHQQKKRAMLRPLRVAGPRGAALGDVTRPCEA